MKFNILIASAFLALTACQNQEKQNAGNTSSAATDTTNYTTIQWIDSLKDVGSVPAGEVAEIKFRFRNTGEKPLLVVSAQPGCGCTVADYPKTPVLPGDEGELTANFDTKKGGGGSFRKSITVTTNTKPKASNNIFFFGNVAKSGGDSTHTGTTSASASISK